MKSSLLTLCLFFLFTSTPLFAQEVPKWIHGSWQGVGYQSPTNSAWEIDLKYDAENNRFSINYPSLGCSGHWKLLESETNRIVLVEQITDGMDKCDNNVKVIVNYVDEEYISVSYFLPKLIDNVVAYSVLKRKGKKVKKT
ncbi:MAG: hypothetical protein DWQ02_28855 [Bacteroidetes bacterium]|nr:MAG: hypothetical protein DWQ02_28855 [Bacteroidota bacterium]